MTGFFDAQKFAAHVRTKRGAQSLRSIVGEIEGVSLSTLSRLENGKIPDMETFLHICDWLDASPDDFMRSGQAPQEPKRSTLEQVLLLLRMDTSLDAEVTNALAVLIQRLIEAQGKVTP